jgi:uncharacterized protein
MVLDSFTLLVTGIFNLCCIPIFLIHAIFSSIFFEKPMRNMKSAVITGASSGIGKEIAIQAQQNGIKRLLLFGRSRDKLNSVADLCRLMGVDVSVFAVDFTSTEGCMEARHAIQDFDDASPVDIIFSNAGQTIQNASGDYVNTLGSEFIHDMLHVNTLAMFEIGTSILERMKTRRRGSIVFTSSINGIVGPSNQIIYNACKSAVLSFARDLRNLMEPHGVTVSVVAPGFTSYTSMTEPQYSEGAKLPRWVTGSPDRLAKKIWQGVRGGKFFITYPYIHYLQTAMFSALGPMGWLIGSKWTMNSGLISPKLT